MACGRGLPGASRQYNVSVSALVGLLILISPLKLVQWCFLYSQNSLTNRGGMLMWNFDFMCYWFALKRLGIWSGDVLVYFPGSKTKGVVMFYSLETNQIKKMKSRSR